MRLLLALLAFPANLRLFTAAHPTAASTDDQRHGHLGNGSLDRRQIVIEGFGTASSSYSMQRNTQCKNCPWSSCLNSGYLSQGSNITFDCWLHGETVGETSTWLKFIYGTARDEFCFVTNNDVTALPYSIQHDIRYCGSRLEMEFYLPSVQTTALSYTECSVCPYRDCDGRTFYQPGTPIQVDCMTRDGWQQFSPAYPNGTKTYYRTPDQCYVSISAVQELEGKPYIVSQSGNVPDVGIQDPLPPCGPVPMLALDNVYPTSTLGAMANSSDIDDGLIGLSPAGNGGTDPASSLPSFAVPAQDIPGLYSSALSIANGLPTATPILSSSFANYLPSLFPS